MVQLVEAGYTKKTFGAEGGIKVHIEEHFNFTPSNYPYIFILTKGSKVPFLIVGSLDADHKILKLEDITNPEDAHLLTGKTVYLEKVRVDQNASKSNLALEDVVDYKLFDSNTNNEVGKIIRTESYPEQTMLIVEHKGQEILIPYAEQWIAELNDEQKQLSMRLPDGLF